MTDTNEDWQITDIDEPLDTDVMCGRGRGTNFHTGNVRFRQMVEDRKEEYRESTRIEKPLVSLKIVREWRAQSPPGRFLKLNKKTEKWRDIGDEKAREKTSQALRERPRDEQQQQENTIEVEAVEATAQWNQTNKNQTNELEKPTIVNRSHTLGSKSLQPDDVDLGDFDWANNEGDKELSGAVALQMENNLSIGAIFPDLFQPKGFTDGSGDGPSILHEILKKDDATKEFLQREASPVPFAVPAIPPRAAETQDEEIMKRHTSNDIVDMEPKPKKRGFNRCGSATSNRLKQMFMHQVLKQEMCMEEFLNIAMRSMGLDNNNNNQSEADEFVWKAASIDPVGRGWEDETTTSPQATLRERTQSEEIEFNMLSNHDVL